MQVRFLTPAEIEMFEASAYYEMQATDLGSHFLDIIEEATNEIKENPRRWPEIDQEIRRRVVRRFPYSILYRIRADEIIIVAIMHQKQRPNYWIDRL
ncbi:type II toxin-antitoxin system RelE/ParE family toxin [Desulfobacterota bacterium M19]